MLEKYFCLFCFWAYKTAYVDLSAMTSSPPSTAAVTSSPLSTAAVTLSPPSTTAVTLSLPSTSGVQYFTDSETDVDEDFLPRKKQVKKGEEVNRWEWKRETFKKSLLC